MRIEENVPLGRLTTVGIGGLARHFARPGTVADLEEALAWAVNRGVDVFTIGLGSNLLIADEGVDALVLRLEGELAEARAEDWKSIDARRSEGEALALNLVPERLEVGGRTPGPPGSTSRAEAPPSRSSCRSVSVSMR